MIKDDKRPPTPRVAMIEVRIVVVANAIAVQLVAGDVARPAGEGRGLDQDPVGVAQRARG